jgi:vacuolar protein sorting-associated protein 13A/C
MRIKRGCRLNKQNKRPQKQGCQSWALGYSATAASENEEPGSDGMTDKQRQELYAAIDYEESDEVAAGLVPSQDIIKAQISAQLRTGPLSLRRGSAAEDYVIPVMTLRWTSFNVLTTSMPLSPLAECTYTMARRLGTLYPDIIRMRTLQAASRIQQLPS